MERSFIVTKESKYFQDYSRFSEKNEQQKAFVKEFLIEKDIEGSTYIVSGDGMMNVPFSEYNKSEITLSIEPTENNLAKFSKMLCKEDRYDMCAFKKSSKIAKEFSQKCVDELIPINLYNPRINDYFVSLHNGIYGCSSQSFPFNDIVYLKISSEHLKEDDTPYGFTEIKLSEYYQIVESLKDKE